jgi:predicted ATPase
MRYRDKSSFLSGVLLSSNISNYLRDNLKALAQNKPSRIEELRISLLLTHLSRIVIALGGLVRGIFADAVYVGPIRASGERYYRWQELAVDRIDPRGDNLAMYLTSLPDSEVERVSRLLQNSFGCRVRKQRSKGHISIEISAEDSGPSWFNIADMGHGFSQLLPIVAQVHAATRGRRARPRFIDDEVQRDERIVAIEQPELHLHPAFQGRLANLFESSMYRPTTTSAGEPTKTLSGIYYVLETHSEALINAVGELISEGKINKEHVAVYVFDKNTEERTIVTRSKFSSDGRLIDWPPGFFMYERK